MIAILYDLLRPTIIFLLFTFIHTLAASHKFKSRLFDRFKWFRPWYRLFYNLVSVLLLLCWGLTLPGKVILYKTTGLLFAGMLLIQLFLLYHFLRTIYTQNGSELLGIKQILIKFRSNNHPGYLDEPQRGELTTTGYYRFMRHPMYTFAIMLIAFSPIMTVNLLYTLIIFTLYFWIGSYFEERNLIRRFGDDYRLYQQMVPRFIPNPFK